MNLRRKNAADFISEYKKISYEKEIISEQMYCIADLYRELLRSVRADEDGDTFLEYKNNLERNLSELNARRGATFLRMKLIDSFIDRLSEAERLIVRRYYIDGDNKGAADDLMDILPYEKTHIYRLRDKALDKIADMMDSFPETERSYNNACKNT